MAKGKKVGKYELGKTLGAGSFSKVKLGVDDKGNRYAVKIIEKEQLVREHMEDQLKREIAVMKLLQHPYVVKLYDVLQTANHIYLVLELVTGGELFDKIVAAKRFTEDVARRYFQQIIVGMHFCHRQGVAHRDLKPENLLVDEKDNIKIMDFGLANMQRGGSNDQTKQNMLSTVCGTPNYVAPEVLKEKGYNGIGADVWSCGVILFVMIAGYLPFDDANLNTLFNKIERGEYRMAKHFSDGAKDLIDKMLAVDPNKRLSMDKVIAHPWFRKDFDPRMLDDDSTIVNPSGKQVEQWASDAKEEESKTAKNEVLAKDAVGAFELIAKLTSGVLTGLISTGTVRVTTRFIGSCGKKDMLNKVTQMLMAMKASPKAKEDAGEIKGFISAPKGLMTYVITVTPLVSPDMSMVEVRRGRGDTFDFHSFYRQVVHELGSTVASVDPQEVQQ